MTQNNGETFSGVIVADGQEFHFIETTGACCGSSIIRKDHALKLHAASWPMSAVGMANLLRRDFEYQP